MPDMIGISGGPEEDRTPDLLIAKDTMVLDINNLGICCRAIKGLFGYGQCTNWAQSIITSQTSKNATHHTPQPRRCWRGPYLVCSSESNYNARSLG